MYILHQHTFYLMLECYTPMLIFSLLVTHPGSRLWTVNSNVDLECPPWIKLPPKRNMFPLLDRTYILLYCYVKAVYM